MLWIVGEIKTIAHKAQIVRLIQGINEKVPGANISAKGSKKEVKQSLTERLEEWREARDGFGWEAAWTLYEIKTNTKIRGGAVIGVLEGSWEMGNQMAATTLSVITVRRGELRTSPFGLVVQPEPSRQPGVSLGRKVDDMPNDFDVTEIEPRQAAPEEQEDARMQFGRSPG
ncbi:hypothetical protein C8R46DRAFT_1040521 [Mycena filopes]|nr:hypothetical protein C8R46DRAFT_1040521 [Mycena filopes]